MSTQSLQSFVKFSGMLAVLLSATYSPAKASAQSLIPNISLIEGGQVCLALCTSTPSQALPNQGLGVLPGQLMQIPGQVLQLPGQILSPQSPQVVRSNPPIMPPGAPIMPPPGVAQAPQPQRTSFLKKIAPVLPVVIQQLAK
jgi:hypothetical protein